VVAYTKRLKSPYLDVKSLSIEISSVIIKAISHIYPIGKTFLITEVVIRFKFGWNMKTVIVAILVLMALVLPAATESVGSRDNPVPIGTSADLGDNWQITVLSVFPNATDEMVYGSTPSMLWFERDPGDEFFLAKIQAKYIGSGSSYLDSDYLSVVGSASLGYRAFGSQADGIIQDYIPNIQEVFTGGVITGIVAWMIPPGDANHLVMYDRMIGNDKRTYMALFQGN
jgi:hypothetical protein